MVSLQGLTSTRILQGSAGSIRFYGGATTDNGSGFEGWGDLGLPVAPDFSLLAGSIPKLNHRDYLRRIRGYRCDLAG